MEDSSRASTPSLCSVSTTSNTNNLSVNTLSSRPISPRDDRIQQNQLTDPPNLPCANMVVSNPLGKVRLQP
ncbi:UNVERIFIED_CONTAM: hypothetical protein RMT77_019213 [Armadillidium vulgare]